MDATATYYDVAEHGETHPRLNLKVWHALQLLDGQREAIIVMNGVEYRLRVTKSGKLVLYK